MNTTAELSKPQTATGSSQLDQLKGFTRVVADTGDFATLKEYQPLDATTNPSLILKAAQMPAYKHLLDKAIADQKKAGTASGEKLIKAIVDDLLILFGVEILKIVPGRVSTETDANLSFDADALVAKGRQFISMYEKQGIKRERILVKIATTWEGIRAAEILQAEGIDCNMTLLFHMAQARASADAGAFLISPFVGRITDWYSKSTGTTYTPETDPGVLSVREIYAYYKANGIPTVVMGASFRSTGQILALAGCDRLTISPALLQGLAASEEPFERKLMDQTPTGKATPITEQAFRWAMNEDAMATELLASGIRGFNKDLIKLRDLLRPKLA